MGWCCRLALLAAALWAATALVAAARVACTRAAALPPEVVAAYIPLGTLIPSLCPAGARTAPARALPRLTQPRPVPRYRSWSGHSVRPPRFARSAHFVLLRLCLSLYRLGCGSSSFRQQLAASGVATAAVVAAAAVAGGGAHPHIAAATSPLMLAAAAVSRVACFFGAAYGICILSADGGADHRQFSLCSFSNCSLHDSSLSIDIGTRLASASLYVG